MTVYKKGKSMVDCESRCARMGLFPNKVVVVVGNNKQFIGFNHAL